MKPQDIVFFIILVALLKSRTPKLLLIVGLVCLAISIPLFQLMVFFTAQRLVMYAGVFFLMATILFGFQNKK